jgi:tetratricopeptide (TPR) repeat protein
MQQARLRAWRIERAAVLASIEPLLGLNRPSDRFMHDEARRQSVRSLLDRAVALRRGGVEELVVHAAFLFDHGEFVSAAEDIETLAQESVTPLTAEVARRYREVVAAGGGEIELTGLPEPTCVGDAFLLAYHRVRARDFTEAVALLESDWLRDHDPSTEMHLAIELDALRPGDRSTMAAARAIYDDVLLLEVRRGRTATTLHLLGAALLGQGRFGEARGVIGEGLELAPRSGRLHMNYAEAARRLGDYDAAIEHARSAIAAGAGAVQPYVTLVRSLVLRDGEGDARSARRRLEEAPIEDAVRDELLADCDLSQALRARFRGDAEDSARLGRRALESLQRARSGDRVKIAIARGLADRSNPLMAVALAASRDPGEWWQLRAVCNLMHDDLSRGETRAVGLLLEALTKTLEPEALTKVLEPEAVGRSSAAGVGGTSSLRSDDETR